MKNFFSKIVSVAKNISNFAEEKIHNISHSTKSKVGAVLTAGFLGVSTNVQATDNWIKVETPGMGPREFSQKYFGTTDWQLLQDRDGNYIINPNKDFKFGREYTINRKEDSVKNDTIHKDLIVKTEEKTKSEISKTPDEEKPASIFNIEYTDLTTGFNMEAYKQAVAQFESNGKYTARNDKKGKENGVDIDKWAFGKYQFTVGTLKGYGVYLTRNGVLDEKRVQAFLGNKELQEDLMNRYIDKSLSVIAGNEKLYKSIISGIVSTPELVATGHIAGNGGIEQSLNRKKVALGGKDWLGTHVRHYAKKVEKTYLSLIAANDNQFNPTISSETSKVQKVAYVVPSISLQDEWEKADVHVESKLKTPKVEKIEVAKAQGANESYFGEKVSSIKRVSYNPEVVVSEVESRVDDIISTIPDRRLQGSIEAKLTKGYETKMSGLYANLYHYDNLANKYESEARSAIRIKREILLSDARSARETASKLRRVINHFEGVYFKQAA